MAQKKKLQVFISSTYTDLQEERQAAVQAILTAGHIPAGMELFAAGDESQMNVIKRWIDESDIYMLILGGRYGSIEPKSQKSYIHLEYEYALEKGKPLFAVVIDEYYLEEKVRKYGTSVIEKEHTEKLRAFRELVCGKMVRFWKDSKDIKLSILEKMSEFNDRDDLPGWILGSEAINTGVVAEEIARLAKENSQLKNQTSELTRNTDIFNGLAFNEVYNLLESYVVEVTETAFGKELSEMMSRLSMEFHKEQSIEFTLLLTFWILRGAFSEGTYTQHSILKPFYAGVRKLTEFGLIQIETRQTNQHSYQFFVLTESGRRFLLHLRKEKNFTEYDDFIIHI